ncbi:MAG: hypothetical protein WC001_08860 [Desulfurivibrionaceae bacterium]
MPAIHKIDNDLKIITTIWSGEVVDGELIDALSKYHQDIRKSSPSYCFFNEILDLSTAGDINLSSKGIRILVEKSVTMDVQGVKTKLAIIVSTPIAYGLGRMYSIYRGLASNSYKEVCVFKNYHDALEWIIHTGACK